MATIKRYLSPKVNNGVSEIFFRISIARGKVYKIKSGIFINPARLKDNGSILYPRANQAEIAQLRRTENEIEELERLIYEYLLGVDNSQVERITIEEVIDRFHNPNKYEDTDRRDFFVLWDEFLKCRELSKNREDIYRSLARALHRFEIHRQQTIDPDFKIDLDSLTAEDLSNFERFYRNEWQYYDEYPQIYLDYPAELRMHHKTHRPQKRGDNICFHMMKKIRTFYNWCHAQGLTANDPFVKYNGVKSEKYGTPYYLTIEERDRIADFDLSDKPKLATQRDIFIFQCLVGCRVSDLRGLTKSNIIGDMLEYVPTKTKKERVETVRVPLCERAQQIIARYADEDGSKLLPFISDQRYNDNIKEICRICGIDRLVTVINTISGKDERKPIYKVASSHMARRTFIGNLYKQVRDPNLIAPLSGHKDGSKSFSRYREIDDDIKRDLINLIK